MKTKSVVLFKLKPDALSRAALVTFTNRKQVEKAFGLLIARQIFGGKR